MEVTCTLLASPLQWAAMPSASLFLFAPCAARQETLTVRAHLWILSESAHRSGGVVGIRCDSSRHICPDGHRREAWPASYQQDLTLTTSGGGFLIIHADQTSRADLLANESGCRDAHSLSEDKLAQMPLQRVRRLSRPVLPIAMAAFA
ncbi:hypothetical protein V2G26_015162 [Clonostachys chloroleuca]